MIQPGDRIINKGQTYRCASLEPYTRKDGSQTQLAVMESECAQCGVPFTCAVPAEASTFSFNRRCAKHKRPGSRCRKRPMGYRWFTDGPPMGACGGQDRTISVDIIPEVLSTDGS